MPSRNLKNPKHNDQFHLFLKLKNILGIGSSHPCPLLKKGLWYSLQSNVECQYHFRDDPIESFDFLHVKNHVVFDCLKIRKDFMQKIHRSKQYVLTNKSGSGVEIRRDARSPNIRIRLSQGFDIFSTLFEKDAIPSNQRDYKQYLLFIVFQVYQGRNNVESIEIPFKYWDGNKIEDVKYYFEDENLVTPVKGLYIFPDLVLSEYKNPQDYKIKYDDLLEAIQSRKMRITSDYQRKIHQSPNFQIQSKQKPEVEDIMKIMDSITEERKRVLKLKSSPKHSKLKQFRRPLSPEVLHVNLHAKSTRLSRFSSPGKPSPRKSSSTTKSRRTTFSPGIETPRSSSFQTSRESGSVRNSPVVPRESHSSSKQYSDRSNEFAFDDLSFNPRDYSLGPKPRHSIHPYPSPKHAAKLKSRTEDSTEFKKQRKAFEKQRKEFLKQQELLEKERKALEQEKKRLSINKQLESEIKKEREEFMNQKYEWNQKIKNEIRLEMENEINKIKEEKRKSIEREMEIIRKHHKQLIEEEQRQWEVKVQEMNRLKEGLRIVSNQNLGNGNVTFLPSSQKALDKTVEPSHPDHPLRKKVSIHSGFSPKSPNHQNRSFMEPQSSQQSSLASTSLTNQSSSEEPRIHVEKRDSESKTKEMKEEVKTNKHLSTDSYNSVKQFLSTGRSLLSSEHDIKLSPKHKDALNKLQTLDVVSLMSDDTFDGSESDEDRGHSKLQSSKDTSPQQKSSNSAILQSRQQTNPNNTSSVTESIINSSINNNLTHSREQQNFTNNISSKPTLTNSFEHVEINRKDNHIEVCISKPPNGKLIVDDYDWKEEGLRGLKIRVIL